ncbi:MAG: hypothetical protein ISS83_00925 [Candidatus Pacebacteria bacterium]|nr:hypothetical protein [Candidatus Paceibacterota bacterium]
MTEKELIGKIQELRQIKPRKDWVLSVKTQILGPSPGLRASETPGFTFFPYFKPALAGLVSVFVLFGLFGFSQNSVPGSFLYSIKKITEKSQSFFVSDEGKTDFSFNLADKRLEELTRIAENNQVKNLPQAITEVQASISEAVKNLSSSDQKTLESLAELGKNKQIAEQILAVQIDSEELDNAYINLTESLIQDLETRTLTEEKQEILSQMKELFELGDYQQALEFYLVNQQ